MVTLAITLLGLCEVDTALLAVSGAHAVAVTDDGLYFYQLSTESVFKFNNELGGVITSTSTGVTTGDSVSTTIMSFTTTAFQP
jgi:hypothetical protein